MNGRNRYLLLVFAAVLLVPIGWSTYDGARTNGHGLVVSLCLAAPPIVLLICLPLMRRIRTIWLVSAVIAMATLTLVYSEFVSPIAFL
jgi:hypothetical protein